ncbi:hypothetical protein LDL08_27210 [Nonomuraea glycinis]|uniref:Uncharacterized protein n=1 Tax=Nonomuraea glycinis TaxID=2047744 RepID=A0A918E7B5_9ACTN|nr:hypothetical protein [Nonomuraea glycinis]MCA2179873.1 hypothetical protein [Nonomuraea glycinis]GGP10418.1 hypothetical protein GCM10012278_49970 [Nonomuraea glycinis]
MARDLDRPRRSHRTDWMALLSGILFIVLGILVLTDSITDPLVMLPVTVVGLGFAGLVAILTKVIRSK